MTIKFRLPMLIVASALACFAVGTQADNSQQSKMTTCNADATTKNLTGDDRKAYMKTCLSATPPAAPATSNLNSQQMKMKTCNADATTRGLTGADRKTYMSTCLKGSATPAGAAPAAPATK
jgi:hypothetical protein